MSIRRQMAVLLIALSTFFVGTTWMMQALVMAPAFLRLEREAAEEDVDRGVDAIRGDIDNLSSLANDWGAWDDTYRFVQGLNPSFRETNLVDETFTNTNTELICILDLAGNIVWADCFDSRTKQRLDAAEFFAFARSAESGLRTFRRNDDFTSGLLNTKHGPMLIASRPVIPTKRDGVIQGAVIMGRFLNKERLESLSERTHLQLSVWPVASQAMPVTVQSAVIQLKNRKRPAKIVQELDADILDVVTVMNDIYDVPAIAVQISVFRGISRQGQNAANGAMMCSLIGVISMNLGTGLALRLRVVEPLQKMATHAARVGETDNLNARLQFTRGDEIGILARSFDRMVERLAESREKIQSAAHRAGMAEIASEVLHNVGNAVNTASCCAELVEDRLTGSRLSGLEMATLMLAEQAPHAAEFFTQDPRGPKLIHYLVSLNSTLQRERCENLDEIRRLQETIRHIRDAIASQQNHARHSDFRQRVDLLALLEESLLVNVPLRQQTGARVKIVAAELPEFLLNRSRMAQVLVNLEKNALLAMLPVTDREHELVIAIDILDNDTLQILIRDTGIGFTPEVKDRLFAQGFTTRTDGSGHGLHYCINVIQEMGGEITAESSGPGTGATFRITIPRAVRRPQRTTPDPHDQMESESSEKNEKVEQYI